MARSPEYQLKILDDAVKNYYKKVEHSIRALKDDEKIGQEWTYIHLENLKDDILALAFLIDNRLIVQMMRDSNEI